MTSKDFSASTSRNSSSCLKLSKAYWKHIHRTSGEDQSARILPYIGLVAGMISGTTSLINGVMGMKNSNNAARSINVSINNFSKYSLVIYKLADVFETEINDIIIPRDQKGTLILNNCKFEVNNGPELHIMIDDGKASALCIAKLGWTLSKEQMRIRSITFNVDRDIVYNDSDCSSIKGNLDYPIYDLASPGNNNVSIIITNPPVKDAECSISINFFDGDV